MACETCRMIFRHAQPAFFGYIVMKFREDQMQRAPAVATSTLRTFEGRSSAEHAIILAMLQTPEELRLANDDVETTAIARLLAHQMAAERKAQRDKNSGGPAGFISVPAQSNYTGCTKAALCWSEPHRRALTLQNENFSRPALPRKFTSELWLVWESIDQGTHIKWKEWNSVSSPLKHQGQMH